MNYKFSNVKENLDLVKDLMTLVIFISEGWTF